MSKTNKGFTLVELLVVIAIIAMLVTLLLPAVQAAREAARTTQCKNHIKQLALACLNAESAHGHLPSNGWGYKWIGDPNLGFGKSQPGGWAFSVLPFVEEGNVWQIGQSQDGDQGLAKMMATPLNLFHCPSRRDAKTYPNTKDAKYFYNANSRFVARGDYACNAGSQPACVQPGPNSISGASSFAWCGPGAAGWSIGTMPGDWKATGISFQRSEVKPRHVSDGMSKTYLIGERYLDPLNYSTGLDFSDDQCLYQGHDNDIARWTQLTPQRDRAGVINYWGFGGAHANGIQISMCDGSVHQVAYDIDRDIHRAYGNRFDH